MTYDTYTFLIFHQNRKRTSNKFAPEIFSFLWYLYFIIYKKEQAINLRQNYIFSYDTYTSLMFHQNRKGTSNKFAPEILSFLWYLYFIINEKEQAINLHQNYFYSYDTYTLLMFHQNRKGASNKFAPEIFLFLWYLSFIINKKEQAIHLHQKYFHLYDTYTFLIFHQYWKGTSNKFAPEIFSSLWYLYFSYIPSKPKRNKQ